MSALVTVVALATAVTLSGCGPAHHRAAPVAAPAVVAAPPATTALPPTALPPTTATTAAALVAPTTARPTAPGPARTAATAAACPPTLAGQLASTSRASEVVTVESQQAADTVVTVTTWQRTAGCWKRQGGPWPGRIGGQGFSDHHREGDDTTPTGAYGFGAVMYGNAPNPGTRYSYHQLVCGDWWDEDSSSPLYNTFQHIACGQQPPFGGGSESLWKEQTAYPSFAVVDYNHSPATAGAGSAIFVHADLGSPTAGCISLALPDLDQLLRWLDPAASPLIVLGPAGEITRF
jgi:L,D-peptidoglycan transpeptidase YkuD (ErfK/YbiS/YcfS/YnhG family)